MHCMQEARVQEARSSETGDGGPARDKNIIGEEVVLAPQTQSLSDLGAGQKNVGMWEDPGGTTLALSRVRT